MQAKLTVGPVDDPFEREADQVADQIMREPSEGKRVQRTCDKCDEEEGMQRHGDGGPGPATAPPIVSDVLSSPGQALDQGTRSFMEDRFGHDFSQVRVHTDARAAESAQAVSATAYTVGQHIVFAPGRYAPHHSQGQHLLGHELTHVLQQTGDRRLSRESTGNTKR
jgi:hypothetical protein